MRVAKAMKLRLPARNTAETVILLSQRKPDAFVEVDLELSELNLTSAETKATYEEIKAYIKEKYDLNVSNLYIAQIKEECGILEREKYNLPKGEGGKKPIVRS